MSTYRITLQFLVFAVLNFGLIIGFYGIPLPFFYCHACPGAVGLCPVGAEQYAVIVNPFLLLYFLAGIFLVALVFGRATCGWGCPVGALQDLFALKSKHRKLNDGYARYVKFGIFGLALLLSYIFMEKVFTDLCPVGFLAGTVPTLLLLPGYVEPMSPFFEIKIGLTVVFFGLIYFVARGWCRYLCPLGAQLALFNKISLLSIKSNKEKCVNCQACGKRCPMGIDPRSETDSIECIRCGRCVESCQKKVISFRARWRDVH
ncbi:MAG: 4Fe-4S binding protein [Thermoplasmata archaeon]|nr:4Fe-4S binding protein [Thermoplasmata archaeon]